MPSYQITHNEKHKNVYALPKTPCILCELPPVSQLARHMLKYYKY